MVFTSLDYASDPMRLPHPFLASIIATVIALPFLIYAIHSPGVFESGFLYSAQLSAQNHSPLSNGDYPPGVSLVYLLLIHTFGSFSIPFAAVFQALLFAIGAGFWFGTLGFIFPKPKQNWIAWAASLLNPYFLWLIVTSKDTAFEWLGVSVFFYCLLALITTENSEKKKLFLSLALTVSFIVSMLLRVTTVFIFLSAILLAFVMHWKTHKKLLLSVLAACMIAVSLFVTYNGQTFGSYGLSTTMKGNLAYGQSPLYEYTHPIHDIDVFLPMDFAADVRFPSPITFIAVSVRKSVWYWLNFEKVPNLSSNTRMIAQTDNTLTLSIEPIKHLPSLLYTLMKLLYIPAFIISLFLWIRRKDWTDKTLIFLVPLLALWPICVLTFPDTRFKIVGEVIAVAFIVYQFTHETEPKTSS